MSEVKIMASACIACRLRRKRCDRKLPICTSCAELDLSPHLCVSPKGKLGLKSKNAKVTLDDLKAKNEKLRREENHLKTLLKIEVARSDARMKLSQILNVDARSSEI